jgi:hypothetical protein
MKKKRKKKTFTPQHDSQQKRWIDTKNKFPFLSEKKNSRRPRQWNNNTGSCVMRRRGWFKYLNTNNLERERELGILLIYAVACFPLLHSFIHSLSLFSIRFLVCIYTRTCFYPLQVLPFIRRVRSLPSRRVWFTHKALASIKKKISEHRTSTSFSLLTQEFPSKRNKWENSPPSAMEGM